MSGEVRHVCGSRQRVAAILAFSILLLPAPAETSPVVFIGSSGTLSAEVTFAQSGTDLIVTLSNLSSFDVQLPSEVLTAVFFTLAGDPTLTPTSAILSFGSVVLFGGTDPGGGVGGEWAYKNHLLGAPFGADEGISSAGFGLFGPGDRFPGSNLQGPANPDGLQYGITSPVDNPATGNRAVTGANALIKHSVVFTLSGLPTSYVLSPASITAVSFQYGTALPPRDPNVPGVFIPEPNSFALTALGLLALALQRRR
jgi:hypothetical protein